MPGLHSSTRAVHTTWSDQLNKSLKHSHYSKQPTTYIQPADASQLAASDALQPTGLLIATQQLLPVLVRQCHHLVNNPSGSDTPAAVHVRHQHTTVTNPTHHDVRRMALRGVQHCL
jgi:hypothetical protein